jgi:hypothetical protein
VRLPLIVEEPLDQRRFALPLLGLCPPQHGNLEHLLLPGQQ